MDFGLRIYYHSAKIIRRLRGFGSLDERPRVSVYEPDL